MDQMFILMSPHRALCDGLPPHEVSEGGTPESDPLVGSCLGRRREGGSTDTKSSQPSQGGERAGLASRQRTACRHLVEAPRGQQQTKRG
jgi:hypothetical protein